MTPNHLGFFLVTIAKHLTARTANGAYKPV